MRWFVLLFLAACSSSTTGTGSGSSTSSGGSSTSSTSSSGGDSACPNVSGDWTVTNHCDSSLIGEPVAVTQTACALSMAPPFDQFTGSVGKDGKVTLSGPQQCTGTASSNTIVMTCTPGTCNVSLGR